MRYGYLLKVMIKFHNLHRECGTVDGGVVLGLGLGNAVTCCR
jgi:hypothetical protein